MGVALLWIISLAGALFFVAVSFSLNSKALANPKSGKKQYLTNPLTTPLLCAGIPILIMNLLLVILAWEIIESNVEPVWFLPYCLLWGLTFISGFIFVYQYATGKKGSRQALEWSSKKLTAGVVASLILFCLVLIAVDQFQVKPLLLSSIEEAQKVEKELDKPLEPDLRNAVDDYERAFKRFGKIPGWVNDNKLTFDFDGSSAEVRSYLKEQRDTIALIKKASEARFYIPFSLDPNAELPKLFNYRNAASLIGVEARAKAGQGNIGYALYDLEVIDRIARQISSNPTVIATLVASSIVDLRYRTAEHILNQTALIQAGIIKKPVEDNPFLQESIKRGLKGEQAFNLNLVAGTLLDHKDLFSSENESSYQPIIIAYNALFAKYDMKFLHEYFDGVYNILNKPDFRNLKSLDKWQTDYQNNPNGGPIAMIATVDVTGYIKKVAAHDAKHKLTNLAFAVKAYQVDNGLFPTSLDALVPAYIKEVPVDPFSGDELRMVSVGGGIILYSVGTDFKDDNGVSKGDYLMAEGDITFTLGAPYKEKMIEAVNKAKEKKARKK